MALTFYYGSGSPYAWKVWLALEHKGIPYEFKLLSFDAGDTKKPEFLQVNPRAQVPAILLSGCSGTPQYQERARRLGAHALAADCSSCPDTPQPHSGRESEGYPPRTCSPRSALLPY